MRVNCICVSRERMESTILMQTIFGFPDLLIPIIA